MSLPLTLALPKGRLLEQVQEHFAARKIYFEVKSRKLVVYDNEEILKIYLVKNSDLPTYIEYGIAGLGVCGEDVLFESGYDLLKLHKMPFGSTRMCLAGKEESGYDKSMKNLKIATKFTRFTKSHFHNRGHSVEIIKLNGSVELAPVLGLTPFIVDLVETGSTLKANSLKVIQELAKIEVYLVANPAYYKIHYHTIQKLLKKLDVDKQE